MDAYPETSFTLSEMPDALKWLRKMRKMKLREVAEACGLSVSFLSDIERRRTPPSLGTLQKLARVYNTPLVLHLTFALRRTNVIPAADRLSALEAWVEKIETFEARIAALENKGLPEGFVKVSTTNEE